MDTFSIKINEEHTLNGSSFHIDNPDYYLLVITGMDEHSKRYEYFANKLNENKISVDVLDFFGQGLNAKSINEQEIWPKNAWSMMLSALKLKIEELRKENKPVFLMGHSMGSILVQNFLVKYPKTADKVIIMSSVGPHPHLYKLAKNVCHFFYRKRKDTKESKLMTKLILGNTNKKIKKPKTKCDWLSYNEENVTNYINDPYCGHYNTWGFYYEFTNGLSQINKKSNLKNLSKDENILIVAGDSDPIGKYSKDIKRLFNQYKKYEIKNVTCKIYPHMRHEILNEVDRDKVINDIVDFLTK